jgi:hypothetical protein
MDRNGSGKYEGTTDSMTTDVLHKNWCCYVTGGEHDTRDGDDCCCGADH